MVVGPNGSRKTTLLRAIMGEQPLAAGRLDLSGTATIGDLPQDDGTASPLAEPALAAFDGAAIVVTHDRYFIERFSDVVVEIG